jgi:hypothetical protein
VQGIPPVEGSGTGNEEAEQERLVRKRVSALEIRENNTSNFRQRQGFFKPFLREGISFRYWLPQALFLTLFYALSHFS